MPSLSNQTLLHTIPLSETIEVDSTRQEWHALPLLLLSPTSEEARGMSETAVCDAGAVSGGTAGVGNPDGGEGQGEELHL